MTKKVNLQSLYQLLMEFDDFPKNGQQLKTLARKSCSDRSVIQFFEAVPEEKVFERRADVFQVAEFISNS